MTTTPTPGLRTITLAGSHAADLADLLNGLSRWIDTDYLRLEPLLEPHNYDIDQLAVTLKHYAALVDPGEVTL